MKRRLVLAAVLAAFMTMANDTSSVNTGLTYAGRALLDYLKSTTVLARSVTRGYSGMAGGYGTSTTIPSIELSGGATARAKYGPSVPVDVLATNRTLTKQHLVVGVALDQVFESVPINSFDAYDQLSQQLAYRLGLSMDAAVAALWNQIPYEVGTTDGTSIWNPAATSDYFGVLADARKLLMENQTPAGDLVFVQGTTESREFRKLPSILAAYTAGDNSALRTGTASPIMGFEVLESQQIASATTTQADVSWTVTGAHARGATSLVIGAAGTGTIPKGMTFKIANVLNNTGHDVRFVVLADATITANAATLSILPALPVALSGTDVVTAISHSAAGSQNLAFHPEGIMALCQVPPAWADGGGVSSVSVDDPASGFAIRISRRSVLLDATQAFQEQLVADCVFSTGVVRPEFCVKVVGKV